MGRRIKEDCYTKVLKTIQKYTPRKTEAKILHLLRNCTEAELKLCLRLIESVKNSINTERRKKHA